MITLREVSAEIVLVGEACMDFAGSAGVCSNTAVRIRAENAGMSGVPPENWPMIQTGRTYTCCRKMMITDEKLFTRCLLLEVNLPGKKTAIGGMV